MEEQDNNASSSKEMKGNLAAPSSSSLYAGFDLPRLTGTN